MTAPIRDVPTAGETIATITGYPELVEAFRTMKARLGLSHEWIEEQCDFTKGYADKVLGPTQAKSISPLTFSMFCAIFGVRFRMEIDLDAVRKMEGHWERREEGKVVFAEARISKKLVSKAKPMVLRQTGQIGGLVTAHMRTPAQRSEAASKAAKSRWKQVRKNRVRCRV